MVGMEPESRIMPMEYAWTQRTGACEVTRQHTTWAIVFAIVILLVLAALPAQAQDIGGATSSVLYLPSIERNFVLWFTDAELDAAMERDGMIRSLHRCTRTACWMRPVSRPPSSAIAVANNTTLTGNQPRERNTTSGGSNSAMACCMASRLAARWYNQAARMRRAMWTVTGR